MRNLKDKEVIVIEKSKIESILITSFLVVMLIFLGSYFIKGVITLKNLESESELLDSIDKSSFIDEELNMTVLYPSRWVLTEIGSELLESKKELVLESSGGKLFNLLNHRLEEEVVSLLLVSNPTTQPDGSQTHSQFMSLTAMGDVNMTQEEKLKFLEERFIESINMSNEGTEYKFQLEKSNTTPNGGFYFEGKVKTEERYIYYAQYTEVVGVNLLTAILGSSVEDATMYDKVFDFISGIKLR